jgi:diguanylate cyclase (GGDEF)-like protein
VRRGTDIRVGHVISIKPNLESNSEGLPTLLRVLHVLLQGMANHVVEYDVEHTARFRRSVEDIAKSFDESQSKSELLFLAGAAVKALDDYNQHASAHFERRKNELASMIKMLTDTVGTISSAGAENVKRLQEIETQLNSAKETSDITVIKVRLGDCLDGIRQELARQRLENEKTAQTLAGEIQKQRVRTGELLDADRLTGLPSRNAAESALEERCASGKMSYVAVLMVDHLQLYNIRFGRTAGDDILRHFAENLRKLLPPRDGFFRWGGPTFVVLLDRGSTMEDTRSDIKRLLDKIPSISLASESRSALLPVTSRWTVFQTSPPAQSLVKKIDMFTSVHAGATG